MSLAPGDAHCFLQTIGPAGSQYHRYPLEDFAWEGRPFAVRIGPHRLSLDGLRVDSPDAPSRLRFGAPVRWPSSPLAPNSMGWYAFARFMECYHGIIILDAPAEGELAGQPAAGRLYLEKDWGVSFPKAWIWTQSSGFPDRGCLTCSVGVVPFRRTTFAGFIVGLHAGGRLHRFATYNGSRLERLEVGERGVEMVFTRGKETLDARVTVRLVRGGRELYCNTGGLAGLEVVAPEVLRDTWRLG